MGGLESWAEMVQKYLPGAIRSQKTSRMQLLVSIMRRLDVCNSNLNTGLMFAASAEEGHMEHLQVSLGTWKDSLHIDEYFSCDFRGYCSIEF